MLKNRFLMKILATTVVATMFVTPFAAYAEDISPKEEVVASESDESGTFGDISASIPENNATLQVVAEDGYTAEVATGNIGLDGSGLGAALVADAESGGVTDVTVNGDIISADTAILEEALEDSTTDVKVTGDVVSANPDMDTVAVLAYSGVYSDEDGHIYKKSDVDNSHASLEIEGDVAVNEGNAIVVKAGVGSTADVKVGGNVITTGDTGISFPAIHAKSYKGDGTNINVLVGGDVLSTGSGVFMQSADNANINVVIEGTLKAEKNAAVLNYSGDRNTITVWKIETPGYTAAQVDNETKEYVEDVETEKKIQYIIRVNQNENATLKATDADGNALATVTGINDNVLEYAYEGDKVLLKIDVADGYSLDAAYGDEGQQLELVKDEAGNYYINVPRNGGVSFSVKLSKIKKDDSSDRKDEDNKQVAGTFVLSDSEAISLISAASAGGSVTLSGLSGTGLSASVVTQLLARRDIATTVTFILSGVLYKITIPAGADIAKLVGADGSISFAALGQEFGMTPA